jgi:predicted ester cyclase
MATAPRTEAEVREFEREFVDEVWNGANYGFIEETHDEDYVGHWFDIAGGDVDRAGLEAFIREAHAGFSDFEMTVEFEVVEDDMGVTGFTVSGTHDGEYAGIPATDEFGSSPGIMAHRFEDGKVVEAWAVWDALGQLQQLGVLPKSFTLASFLETGANLAKQDVLKLAKGE